MDFIILAGLFISVIIATAFGIKSKKQIANFWLAAFLFSNATVLLVKFAYHTGYIIEYPHLFKLNYLAGILRPVLIYSYVYFLFIHNKKASKFYPLHFLPFIFLLIYLFPFLVKSTDYKLAVLNLEIINTLGVMPSWYLIFQLIYSLAYLILIHSLLKQYINSHPRPNKSQESIISWIKLLFLGSVIYLSIALGLKLTGLSGEYNYYLHIVFSTMLILLCIKLLTLPELIIINYLTKEKYNNSTLTSKNMDIYYSKINGLMVNENLYREKDLKLGHIAARLGIPEYVVSQIINEKSGKPFRDYLNEHRIIEAKKMLLANNKNYSIEGTAYDVGFNSRASFYSAFKKFTQLTPSQYIKSIS
jgi:AraC-like DNA-binding protein